MGYLLAQLLVPTSGAAMEQFQMGPVVGTEKWRVQDGNTLVSTTLCPVQDAHPVRPVKQLLQFPVLPTSATAVHGAPEGYPKAICFFDEIGLTIREKNYNYHHNRKKSITRISSISIVINCIDCIFSKNAINAVNDNRYARNSS